MLNKIKLLFLLWFFVVSIIQAEKVTIWEFDSLTPVNAQLDTTAGTAWDPATSSVDKSNFKSGVGALSGSMSVGPAPAVNAQITNWGTIASPYWTTPLNVDASGITKNYVSVWVYLQNNATWADDYIFSVKIGSGATIESNNKRYVWRQSDFPGGLVNGWNFFEKSISNTFSQVGTLNWADIDWIEVQIYSSTGKPSSIVKLDNLLVSDIPGPHDTPSISLINIWEFDALTPVQAQLDSMAGTGWNPTTSVLDTVEKKTGTASLRGIFNPLPGGTNVNAQVTNWGTLAVPVWTTPLNVNASGIAQNYLSIWCYMENNNSWADDYIFSVKIGSGATIDSNNKRYVWRRSDFPGGLVNGWNFFEKPITETLSQVGTLNWSDIDWLEIQIYGLAGNPSSIVRLDSLRVSDSSLVDEEYNWKTAMLTLRDSGQYNYSFNVPTWLREGKHFAYPVDREAQTSFFDSLGRFDERYSLVGATYYELQAYNMMAGIGWGLMNDGDYTIRYDMGGWRGLRDMVSNIHSRGGRMILYVEGLLTNSESDVSKSGRSRSWSIQLGSTTPEMYRDNSSWYPGYWKECVASTGWQDYLAGKCAELVRKCDVDGFYIDSLGATGMHRCDNPGHPVNSDDDYKNAAIQLFNKVKNAMVLARPDDPPIIFCEGFQPEYYQVVNGSKNITGDDGEPGDGKDPASTTPDMREFPWRFGYPEMIQLTSRSKSPYTTQSKSDDINICFVNGTDGIIYGYWDPPLFKHNWVTIRRMFQEALVYGFMQYYYPVAEDPGIQTRLFKSANTDFTLTNDYYLVTGARLYQDSPTYTNGLTIKGISENIQYAIVINIETMQINSVPIQLSGDNYFLSIPSNTNFFVIFLPVSGFNRPLVQVNSIPDIYPGQTANINFSLLNTWSTVTQSTIKIGAPGLSINGSGVLGPDEYVDVSIPSTVAITAPSNNLTGGSYRIMIDGDSSSPQVLSNEYLLKVLNPVEVIPSIYTQDNEKVVEVTVENKTNELKYIPFNLYYPNEWQLGGEVSVSGQGTSTKKYLLKSKEETDIPFETDIDFATLGFSSIDTNSVVVVRNREVFPSQTTNWENGNSKCHLIFLVDSLSVNKSSELLSDITRKRYDPDVAKFRQKHYQNDVNLDLLFESGNQRLRKSVSLWMIDKIPGWYIPDGTNNNWWNTSWSYRVPITIKNSNNEKSVVYYVYFDTLEHGPKVPISYLNEINWSNSTKTLDTPSYSAKFNSTYGYLEDFLPKRLTVKDFDIMQKLITIPSIEPSADISTPTTLEVLENGPVRTTIKTVKSTSTLNNLTKEYYFYKDFMKIKVDVNSKQQQQINYLVWSHNSSENGLKYENYALKNIEFKCYTPGEDRYLYQENATTDPMNDWRRTGAGNLVYKFNTPEINSAHLDFFMYGTYTVDVSENLVSWTTVASGSLSDVAWVGIDLGSQYFDQSDVLYVKIGNGAWLMHVRFITQDVTIDSTGGQELSIYNSTPSVSEKWYATFGKPLFDVPCDGSSEDLKYLTENSGSYVNNGKRIASGNNYFVYGFDLGDIDYSFAKIYAVNNYVVEVATDPGGPWTTEIQAHTGDQTNFIWHTIDPSYYLQDNLTNGRDNKIYLRFHNVQLDEIIIGETDYPACSSVILQGQSQIDRMYYDDTVSTPGAIGWGKSNSGISTLSSIECIYVPHPGQRNSDFAVKDYIRFSAPLVLDNIGSVEINTFVQEFIYY